MLAAMFFSHSIVLHIHVPMFTILETTKFNFVCLSHFQIESLDDHSGRLLIKLALGGTKDWFNEFMVQPVSKAEYAQYGKVLSKFNNFFDGSLTSN